MRILLACLLLALMPNLHTEPFDRDPGWDGYRNRSALQAGREVKQDFGWSPTQHAKGRSRGEIGGLISPAWEGAYYAAKIPAKTFNDRFSASGTLNCTTGKFHALISFFNADTMGAWRAPNSFSLRINGRGDCFYAYVEYCTSKFRAGGDSPQGFVDRDPATGKADLKRFPLNTPLRWSIDYDPSGNNGSGAVKITLGDTVGICYVSPQHRTDGATFNRFGLVNVMKSVDDAGEVWLDDIIIEGKREDLSKNPGWEAVNNRRTYTTTRVRPTFDFGYTPTNHAGGKGRGEIGGVTFRGDVRYADKMGYYGARLETLDLTKPMRAGGRICLRRGASDSTTLIGFFHSKESVAVRPDDQKSSWPLSFLGMAVEGPSGEGFSTYPVYRFSPDIFNNSRGDNPPYIYPNGKSHAWTLVYTPGSNGSLGKIVVTLDGQVNTFTVPAADQRSGAEFDRFGIISTAIDGNGQEIYFDDLEYTVRQ